MEDHRDVVEKGEKKTGRKEEKEQDRGGGTERERERGANSS